MIILSNCITDNTDEGCIKVANSLVKRIKKHTPDLSVVSYERQSVLTDRYIEMNKLMFNYPLFSEINQRKETVIYMPFPARTIATALRMFVLSLFIHKRIKVVLVMNGCVDYLSKVLMRAGRFDLILISEKSAKMYKQILPEQRVKYIKMGVDTKKFIPVTKEKSRKLKIKYGLQPDKPVILHVGHMNRGRNIEVLSEIDNCYQVLLITSTFTKDEQDSELKQELQKSSNIRIIDDYLENIEEIYQLSDVYFFPVLEDGHCIDVPLSCLEAASCNKAVISTRYGEMERFSKEHGFFFLNNLKKVEINSLIEKALNETVISTRTAIMEYDWNKAVSKIMKEICT